ncbi:PqqD family protein [Agromyces tardus]|uniref:PqqD family protein n=1 Tax=Agromyces tardus TaxID=2583849 RepID=A0A3M8AFX0_9MICO|nr:PqqD family protein [Agromyces tardus]RNB50078.1 PqqD family protein [Agromyces tardus]
MGGYRPGEWVGVLEHEDVLYAAILPDGPIAILDGIAGLIWIEACEGPAGTLVERIATATGAEPQSIRAHVESFVDDLVRRRLLVAGEG